MEKSSSISIKAFSVNFTWNSSLFQLVDTPDHLYFSTEGDRSL
jgi:peptide subunit release factor RF-3